MLKAFQDNNFAQIFFTGNELPQGKQHAKIHPMKTKADVSLRAYCTKYGIPNPLTSNHAREETSED